MLAYPSAVSACLCARSSLLRPNMVSLPRGAVGVRCARCCVYRRPESGCYNTPPTNARDPGEAACNVPRSPPDIKNMNALIILVLLLSISFTVTLLGKQAITTYYQSDYYYVKRTRNRSR